MKYKDFTQRFERHQGVARDEEFHILYRKLPQIDYNPDWANGTGFFDGAVKDRTIRQASACQDPIGRWVIILPGLCGNIVLFKRFCMPESSIYAVSFSGELHGTEMVAPKGGLLHLILKDQDHYAQLIREINNRVRNVELTACARLDRMAA